MWHVGECGIGLREAVGIDVTEADELHFGMGSDLFEVGEGHPIRADSGDLEVAVGGGATGDGGECCGEGSETCGFDEGSSGGVHTGYLNRMRAFGALERLRDVGVQRCGGCGWIESHRQSVGVRLTLHHGSCFASCSELAI